MQDIPINTAIPALDALDPHDVEVLLRVGPAEVLGNIIQLNRGARYHNSLDAIAVLLGLLELRALRTPCSFPAVPSLALPGSSISVGEEHPIPIIFAGHSRNTAEEHGDTAH